MNSTGYKLAYKEGWIYATGGSSRITQSLLYISGAVAFGDVIALPVGRAIFLAVEAAMSIYSVSEEYKQARAECMAISMDKIERIKKLLYDE